MQTSNIILIGLTVCGAVAIHMLLRSSKTKGTSARSSGGAWPHTPTKASSKRSADARTLSPQELQFFRKARALADKGKFKHASEVLEQIGLHREAISLLEEAGLIEDAALVLLKMRRPNRAGAVYARHKMWAEAADCFRQAGMMVETAKSLWECKRYVEAAKFFLDGNRQEEAAVCYVAANNWHAAAKLYLKLGMKEKSVKAYESLFASSEDLSGLVFDSTELDFIQGVVLKGELPTGFVEVLSRNGRAIEVIKHLLADNKLDFASRLYQSSTSDLGPLLMSEVNLQSKDAKNLVSIFKEARQMRYAGMVCEQMGDFASAGKCFEECQEFERASYCWERAGDRDRAKLASARVAKNRADAAGSGFSFAAQESQTQVIDTSASNPSLAKPQFATGDGSTPPRAGAGVFLVELTKNGTGTSSQPNHVAEDRKVFNTCVLFEGLDSDQLESIWNIKRLEMLDPGSDLYRSPGEPAGIYLILEGTVERRSEESSVYTLELQAGDHFGENWTLAQTSEAAHFRTKTACRLLLLEQTRFVEVLETDGKIAYNVYKSFTAHAKEKEAKSSKPKLNLVAS